MLPNEYEAFLAITEKAPNHVALARDSVRFGVNELSKRAFKIKKTRGATQTVVHAVLGLAVKSTRIFRSIALLAQRGLVDEGFVLGRTLFETFVAIQFICKPRVRLVSRGRSLPPVPGKPLTTHFRAVLIFAHAELELERLLREQTSTKGLQRTARSYDAARVKLRADAARKALGTQWETRIAHGKYAGVSFRDLCMSLGLQKEYASNYRAMSWGVHAVDSNRFATLTGADKRLEISVGASAHLADSLLISMTALYLMCWAAIENRFEVGAEQPLNELIERARGLAGRRRRIRSHG